jgi:hypothetical protein
MLYRPSTRELRFYQSMNDSAAAFTTFDAGTPGDLPIAGHWDGDGVDGYGSIARAPKRSGSTKPRMQ